jgi:hypothetical protein
MGKVGGGYLVFTKCRVMGYSLADIKLPVGKTSQRDMGFY